MKSCDGAIPVLAFEVITLILLRLPIRSICRFKCVSKAWLHLISDQKFAKKHFDVNNKNQKERLCFVSESNELYSLDPKSPDPTAVQLKFRDQQNPIQFVAIWASCDGLLLLSDVHFSLFLANPLTGEYKKLSQSPFFLHTSAIDSYGLGYDSAADDYKVVQIIQDAADSEDDENIVSVYSLRANSWRSTESSPKKLLLYSCSQGVYVNGSLHWLGESDIIALNLECECFYTMPLPGPESGNEELDELNIIGNCLCRIEGDAEFVGRVNVWVMKEYGVHNSWLRYIVNFGFPFFKFMVPSRTGKFLFYGITRLFVYDIEKDEFEEIAMDFPDDTLPTTCEESLIPLLERN